MLKKLITFTDFNGDTQTEAHYFNLTQSELIELELGLNFGESLKTIAASQDPQALIAEFKKVILGSYGEKSADGKRFVKSDQLRLEFSQTAAYNALFMELATNDNAALEFIKGILPADMSDGVEKEMKDILKQHGREVQTETTPTPPPVPTLPPPVS